MRRSGQMGLTLKPRTVMIAIALLGAVSALCGMSRADSGYQVIKTLDFPPVVVSSVVQDATGYLYGTTLRDSSGGGTLYKVAPDGSGFAVLHNFDVTNDGGESFGLTLGSDGQLYGTTNSGGAHGEGTVFRIAPDGSGFAVLHTFQGGPDDGANPAAGLTLGSSGIFYGTTQSGGSGYGTVYKIAADGTFNVLHKFDGTNDGANPSAALTQGSDGNFYGTAANGGSKNTGTLFRIAPDGTGFSKLHDFNPANGEGSNPTAALTLSKGKLFGTTPAGEGNSGTVYRISQDGSGFTVLHSFQGAPGDGANPAAGLTLGSGGNLYGTTINGGSGSPGYGTVYKIAPDGSGFKVLYDFDGTKNQYPHASLTLGSDGNFYGTSYYTGTLFSTVYKIAPNGSGFGILHSFEGINKARLYAGLTVGSNGRFYGASLSGRSYGTLYTIDDSGSEFSLLHSFIFADGANPYEAPIQGSDGNFYGTTSVGGPSNSFGTVYKVNASGKDFILLHSFSGLDDGANPAGLTLGSKGIFYGTAQSGGSGYGTVYKIAADGTFTVLHDFDETNDGGYPFAGLTLARDLNLYGVTIVGGAYNFGTVYKITPNGTFKVLHDFDGPNDGAHPEAGLTLGSGANLYGTTPFGGAYNFGTVYKITPNGTFKVLHDFDGINDGANPDAGLTLGSDGNFYGTTHGGSAGYGTVYELSPDGAAFTVLHDFDYTNGGFPYAGLTQGRDGNFYGTTWNGAQGAVIYRVCPATCTTTILSSRFYAFFGSPVTFSAIVAGSDPTGMVTFRDGTRTLGTGTVSDSRATFTTGKLTVGTHSITASYGGDAYNSPSNSNTLSEVVKRPPVPR